MTDLLIAILSAVIVSLFFPFMWRMIKDTGEFITNELGDSFKTALILYKNVWKEFIEDFKGLFVSKRKKDD